MDANFTGEFFVPGASPERLNADHLNRYRFATDYASAAARALDIACGTGYGSAILKDAGAGSVTGVDLSVEALGHAQKHFGREGVTFTTGDITEFDAEPFDLITCFETIEHVADAAAALTNLRRLLREGGDAADFVPESTCHLADGCVNQRQAVERVARPRVHTRGAA